MINSEVENKILTIKDIKVILDSDVALLYGVETKHVNQAVKNNHDKFPDGYIIILTDEDWQILRSKNLTTISPKSRVFPKAFTEKGLYMLATILKSKKATETTIAIIEAFSKLRALSGALSTINQTSDSNQQKKVLKQTGIIISDNCIIILLQI